MINGNDDLDDGDQDYHYQQAKDKKLDDLWEEQQMGMEAPGRLDVELINTLIAKMKIDPNDSGAILGASFGIMLGFINHLAERIDELQALAHKHEDI